MSRPGRGLALTVTVAVAGCNAILGNDVHSVASGSAAAGGRSGSGAGVGARAGTGDEPGAPSTDAGMTGASVEAGTSGEAGTAGEATGGRGGTGTGGTGTAGKPASNAGSSADGGEAGTQPNPPLTCEQKPCFTADAALVGHGKCKAGTPVCSNGEVVECHDQVLPEIELCGGAFDGIDENCDGESSCTGAVVRSSTQLYLGGQPGADFMRLRLDSHGNEYLLGGYTQPLAIGGYNLPGSGDQVDIFYTKTDATGKVLWAKGITGSGWQLPRDLCVNSNDDITIAGLFTTSEGEVFKIGPSQLSTWNVGSPSGFIARFDSNGTPLWADAIETKWKNNPNSHNTNAFDYPSQLRVAPKPDGGVYAWVITHGPIVFVAGSQSIEPTLTFGDVSWGTPLNSYAYFFDIGENGALLHYFAGGWGAEVDSADVLLTANGVLWVSGYNSNGYGLDFGDIGKQAVDSPGFLLKVLPHDSNSEPFETDWAANIGNLKSNKAYLAADQGGNVYFTGNGVFLTKFNPQGGDIWTKTVTGITTEGITIDNAGYVTLVGTCQGQIDFDPGKPGGELAANATGGDFCIVKYDSNGAFFWARVLGDQAFQSARAVAADSLGYLHVIGTMLGTMNLDGKLDAGAGAGLLRTVLFP